MKKVLLDQDKKIIDSVDISDNINYVGYDDWIELTSLQIIQYDTLAKQSVSMDVVSQFKLKIFNPIYNFYLINDKIERKLDIGICTAVKQQILKSECSNTIISGFKSSALGSEHTYPSNETDQKNLNGCVTSSMLYADDPDWTINFWCSDSSGNWAFTPHTAKQIQQVGKDCIAFIQAQQDKCNLLISQLAFAKSEADFNKIVW